MCAYLYKILSVNSIPYMYTKKVFRMTEPFVMKWNETLISVVSIFRHPINASLATLHKIKFLFFCIILHNIDATVPSFVSISCKFDC